jgi:hypothetical protein
VVTPGSAVVGTQRRISYNSRGVKVVSVQKAVATNEAKEHLISEEIFVGRREAFTAETEKRRICE